MNEELTLKHKNLIEFLEGISSTDDIAVAFSGGVDSTYLLYEMSGLDGCDVHAITVASPFFPDEELAFTEEFCERAGIRQIIVNIDVLSDEDIASNPNDRCYSCKHLLFSEMMNALAQNGISVLLDGTNADDLKTYRPGIRALQELKVVSPLAECGLTKDDIRMLSEDAGLSTHAKPAMACLATRFPVGHRLDVGSLRAVELAESFLHDIGLTQVRVRVIGEGLDVAKVEVDPVEFPLIFQGNNRESILSKLTEIGFNEIFLDLAGYRMGSMEQAYRS